MMARRQARSETMDDTQTRQIYKLAQLRLMITAATMQALLRKANFNPDQPRIPAGEPGGGRWTDGSIVAVAERPDYVDLRREEGKRGAHTIRKHVGKTDPELMAGMGPPANRWWPILQGAVRRNGTFFSIEDANSYVNDTLRANAATVEMVANGTSNDRVFLNCGSAARLAGKHFDPIRIANRFFATHMKLVSSSSMSQPTPKASSS